MLEEIKKPNEMCQFPCKNNVTAQTKKIKRYRRQMLKFVLEKYKHGCPISLDTISTKALEMASPCKIPQQTFKTSVGWTKWFMKLNGPSHQRRTSAQKFPAHYDVKLTAFKQHVNSPCWKHNSPLCQMGNEDEIPLFFNMTINYTTDVES
jgi:hypothetical protein